MTFDPNPPEPPEPGPPTDDDPTASPDAVPTSQDDVPASQDAPTSQDVPTSQDDVPPAAEASTPADGEELADEPPVAETPSELDGDQLLGLPAAHGLRSMPLGSVLAGLGAVLLLVAAVGIGISGHFHRKGPSGTNGSSTRSTTTGPRGPTTTAVPVVSIPAKAADDPMLPKDAVHIPFDSVGLKQLAPVKGIGPWFPLTGNWVTRGGQAQVGKGAGPRSLTVLAPARAPVSAQVTIATVDRNAGLVVRFLDPTHYVLVLVLPAQKAVWLARVNGDPVHPLLLATVPKVPVADGIKVGVRMTSTSISLVINGVVARIAPVDANPKAVGVGLAASGDGTRPKARFDDLVVAQG